ncbi:GNAT family N-acetyltransferase [Patescibacteria group bacterium]|nr:GNAT family N-acetyltransferase [Patescibacteria group bacterium]MBU2159256.1 GNAT family N-acetyltransferase [Patescibacteria group bacterium]MBU2220672.1 GNAT family N-acetyltransferase [Patescibacteria group bacterium]
MESKTENVETAHLAEPSVFLMDSYIEATKEFKSEGLYPELDLEDRAKNFPSYIEELKLHRTAPPEGLVPMTFFWLVNNNEYIGRVSVRHELNENLLRAGGHIGYDIRPSKRRLGYGKRILELALIEAKKLGIHKVLVTCDSTNIASRKIIESNGGVFENEMSLEEGLPNKLRFWISLT